MSQVETWIRVLVSDVLEEVWPEKEMMFGVHADNTKESLIKRAQLFVEKIKPYDNPTWEDRQPIISDLKEYIDGYCAGVHDAIINKTFH